MIEEKISYEVASLIRLNENFIIFLLHTQLFHTTNVKFMQKRSQFKSRFFNRHFYYIQNKKKELKLKISLFESHLIIIPFLPSRHYVWECMWWCKSKELWTHPIIIIIIEVHFIQFFFHLFNELSPRHSTLQPSRHRQTLNKLGDNKLLFSSLLSSLCVLLQSSSLDSCYV